MEKYKTKQQSNLYSPGLVLISGIKIIHNYVGIYVFEQMYVKHVLIFVHFDRVSTIRNLVYKKRKKV